MKTLADRASSWTSNETGGELDRIQRRASESVGFAMNVDAFTAREEYARNYPGPDGPERHLRELVRRSERSVDEAIALALGRKGGGK